MMLAQPQNSARPSFLKQFTDCNSFSHYFADFFSLSGTEGRPSLNTIQYARFLGMLLLLSMQLLHKKFLASAQHQLQMKPTPKKIRSLIRATDKDFAEYGKNFEEIANNMRGFVEHIKNPTAENQARFLIRLDGIITAIRVEYTECNFIPFVCAVSQAFEYVRTVHTVVDTNWTEFEHAADLTLVMKLTILKIRWLQIKDNKSDLDFLRNIYKLLSTQEKRKFMASAAYGEYGKWFQFEIDAKCNADQLEAFNRMESSLRFQNDITDRQVNLYQKLYSDQRQLYQQEKYYGKQYPWIVFAFECKASYQSLRIPQLRALDKIISFVRGDLSSPLFRAKVTAALTEKGTPLLYPEQLQAFNRIFPAEPALAPRVSEVHGTMYQTPPTHPLPAKGEVAPMECEAAIVIRQTTV